jgi:hypothetical protein
MALSISSLIYGYMIVMRTILIPLSCSRISSTEGNPDPPQRQSLFLSSYSCTNRQAGCRESDDVCKSKRAFGESESGDAPDPDFLVVAFAPQIRQLAGIDGHWYGVSIGEQQRV